MAAIDWATPLAALVAVLPETGAEHAIGAPLVAVLTKLGAAYDARWSGTVDAAKTIYLAAAETAHDAADEAARFVARGLSPGELAALRDAVEDAATAYVGAPSNDALLAALVVAAAEYSSASAAVAALPFDPYSDAAILARLTAAEPLASTALTKKVIAFHRSAVGAAYAFGGGSGNTYVITLGPHDADAKALDALINELFIDHNAHVIRTAGVHGAADFADVIDSVAFPRAKDTATRVARVNAIRSAFQLHRVKVSGVHGAADTANGIAAPAATDDASALTLAVEIRADYNAHRVLVAGGVHGAPDAQNPTKAGAALYADPLIAFGSQHERLVHGPSIRQLELELLAAIADAGELAALIAYP